MSLNPEGLAGILPEQAIATAVAIAERSAQIQDLNERIGAELEGVPYAETPVEVRRASHLGRATLMLMRIENPDKVIPLVEINAAHNGPAGYAYKAEVLAAEIEVPVDADVVRSIEAAAISEMQTGSGLSDDLAAQDFAKQLMASKRVAEAHGVELATVYTDDALYYEACREARPPEKIAEQVLSIIDSTSTDMMLKVSLAMLDRLTPQDVRSQMTDEEWVELGLELQLDPVIRLEIAAITNILQETMRQAFLYVFIKTYGYDAVNRLSAEYRESLLPKMPLTTELAALVNASPQGQGLFGDTYDP